MQDYDTLLRRAIADLDPDTTAERRKLYARARTAAVERLRQLTPPASDRVIQTELGAIGAAIRRLEESIPPGSVGEAVAEDEAYGRDHVRDVLHPWMRPAQIGAAVTLALAVGAGAYWLLAPKAAVPRPVPAQASTQSDGDLAYVFRTQPVYYRSTFPAGTVVVNKLQHFLYVVQPNQVAVRYGVAIGKECENLNGVLRVTQKQEPMVAVASGERATAAGFTQRVLHLSEEPARIHATRSPRSIGENPSSGCIQLLNPGMSDLYERVPLGARVVVAQ